MSVTVWFMPDRVREPYTPGLSVVLVEYVAVLLHPDVAVVVGRVMDASGSVSNAEPVTGLADWGFQFRPQLPCLIRDPSMYVLAGDVFMFPPPPLQVRLPFM